jgi:hypothetical protein
MLFATLLDAEFNATAGPPVRPPGGGRYSRV